jgi:integrase
MSPCLVMLPGCGLRAANARLKSVVEAKDAEIARPRLELDAACKRERRTELRLAELERRLGMDSSNSGTPSSGRAGHGPRQGRDRRPAPAARRRRRRDRRERAGLEGIGAHRLRHTAARAMVAARSPLPQIGRVLRHRSPVPTAGYARAGLDQLRELARPWPAAAADEEGAR